MNKALPPGGRCLRLADWSSPPFPTYELHVWVWKHNPNGMYATTNPTMSCDAGV
jgi:hypothetical protein